MYEPTENILSIKPGGITVKATITNLHTHRIRNGNLMTDAVIADKTGSAKAVWFSKHPKGELIVGSEYIFSGSYQLKYGRLALQSPRHKATGEAPPMDELAKAPLILPARNYPSREPTRKKWPEWIGGAIFWVVIIVAGVAYATSNHSRSLSTPPDTNQSQSSNSSPSSSQGSVAGYHNGIPEIHSPGPSENNSSCIDVTSYDYDWDDDILCTRPDGSQFYTNYAGGQATDHNL